MCLQTDRHTDQQTDRLTNIQRDKQTDQQTVAVDSKYNIRIRILVLCLLSKQNKGNLEFCDKIF